MTSKSIRLGNIKQIELLKVCSSLCVIINIEVVPMFYPKRRPERMMMKYNKLYLIIIVVCHVQRKYKANIIPGQNPFDQRSDFIVIDDRETLETPFNLVEESGVDTGSAFGFLPIPFVSIALLMMAIGMLIMPSSVTSRATIAPRPDVQIFLAAPTPAPAQTTPCIPTNCPADYSLLDDQTAGQNCYLYGGNAQEVWSDALKVCTSTPGAYLWRPNTRAEADAVKNKFTIVDPNGQLGEDCVTIEFDTGVNPDDWQWENDDCDDDFRYICEFPRKTCP
ncbi:uncharacterized protein [Mytilus edulis]|uniref:uncharacterized protein isoform X2 n=1 Tax=Mytilus edulis TaxID=6550 RepID=UPI0039EFB666